MTVVFDGARAPEATPERDRVMGVRVVFSRRGETRRHRDRAHGQTGAGEGRRGDLRPRTCAGGRGGGATVVDSLEFEARVTMAVAIGTGDGAPEEETERRVSTRKKGQGRRLPKRMRQALKNASKL